MEKNYNKNFDNNNNNNLIKNYNDKNHFFNEKLKFFLFYNIIN